MKNSNVEWIGEIPNDWNTVSCKQLYDIQLGKMLQNAPMSTTDTQAPYLKALNVLWGEVVTDDLQKMWATLKDIEKFEVQNGDLLVCEGGEVGRAAIATNLPTPCIIQNALHRVRSKGKGNLKFLAYVLEASKHMGWFEVICNKATIAHFTGEKFAEFRMPSPVFSEQQAIADFLDRKTAEIDNLIAKKERMIELLKEKRQAAITRAVTKGLNPDVEMDESGVEWIGKKPKHWKMAPLKRVANIRYGLGQPPREVEGGCPLIRATNVSRGKISNDGMIYVDSTLLPTKKNAELVEGEIIVVRSGAYTGDSAIITKEFAGAIAGYDMVVTINNGFPCYYSWYILSDVVYELQFNLCKLRAAMPHLNAEDLGDTIVSVPPHNEQVLISNFISSACAKIDVAISAILLQIRKLKEYRQSIIMACITGKVRV